MNPQSIQIHYSVTSPGKSGGVNPSILFYSRCDVNLNIPQVITVV
jgi:hypothetical protein